MPTPHTSDRLRFAVAQLVSSRRVDPTPAEALTADLEQLMAVHLVRAFDRLGWLDAPAALPTAKRMLDYATGKMAPAVSTLVDKISAAVKEAQLQDAVRRGDDRG